MPAAAATNLTNIPGANITGTIPAAALTNVALGPLEDDIAVLGFQVAAASDLAQYNLRDQIVNTFQDATGVDASASTNEVRNGTGKYWSGSASPTGGTVTTYSTYTVHTFTSSGTFDAGGGGSVDALVLAGGGGGGSGGSGWWGGGGGGAGGMLEVAAYTVAGGTHSITVGAGGAGGPADDSSSPDPRTQGVDGGDSVFATFTAVGGGGGGVSYAGGPETSVALATGKVGGSGGGGAGDNTGPAENPGGVGTQPAPANSTGYGYNGGWGRGNTNSGLGGGGGGAGGVGSNNIDGNASPCTGGGPGRDNSLQTGSNQTYGVGGHMKCATLWPANTGHGGGSNTVTAGYAGSSGVVVIRYTTGNLATALNMTLVSDATTAEAGTTATGDVVMLYTPTTGTTTLNTDLKAYVSRDNGTTYTQATLVGKGSYSGTTEIASAHDLDISAQPAGVAMRWKIETLNQSVSKETRINGMSLGWS